MSQNNEQAFVLVSLTMSMSLMHEHLYNIVWGVSWYFNHSPYLSENLMTMNSLPALEFWLIYQTELLMYMFCDLFTAERAKA